MAKIGIIGAMELEVDALKAAMEVKNTVTRAGMEFKEGTLNGADVVVVRSGIGKVNAALCVQTVSYTHLRAHETDSYLVCRLLLEKKNSKKNNTRHHQYNH